MGGSDLSRNRYNWFSSFNYAKAARNPKLPKLSDKSRISPKLGTYIFRESVIPSSNAASLSRSTSVLSGKKYQFIHPCPVHYWSRIKIASLDLERSWWMSSTYWWHWTLKFWTIFSFSIQRGKKQMAYALIKRALWSCLKWLVFLLRYYSFYQNFTWTFSSRKLLL